VPANVERNDGCSGKESREEDREEEDREEEAVVASHRLTLTAAAVRYPGRRSFFFGTIT